MNIESTASKLLIVEGTHDVMLIEALLRTRGASVDELQIMPIGGKNQLYQNLNALILDVRFPDVQAIGIVRDADLLDAARQAGEQQSAAALALEAVRGCLRNANLPVPDTHNATAEGPPRVSVFIAPDGVSDGMLETLCVESVAQTAPFECVLGFFDCLSDRGITPVNSAKAQAHAYIAACADPAVHVGAAARNGYWNLGDTAFDGLFDFVVSL